MHRSWAPGLLVVMLSASACAPEVYVVAMPTRVPAVIDARRFRRILVAGFQTPPAEIDTNEEMVRLLRSQLRSRSDLRVIDADPLTIGADTLGDSAYWKRVGEEYSQPLIVTGSIKFRGFSETTPPGAGARPRGSPALVEDVSHFVLESTFLFVDGNTGGTLLSRTFRQDALYRHEQFVPALAAFFECSDRLMPGFLHQVSEQEFAGTRLLLK